MRWAQDMRSVPIAIFEDRYRGAYSGGKWVAIAGFCSDGPARELLALLAADDQDSPSPWAQDVPTMRFWQEPPAFVAVGDTPDEALKALNEKDSQFPRYAHDL